jgi:hypothetical protein
MIVVICLCGVVFAVALWHFCDYLMDLGEHNHENH